MRDQLGEQIVKELRYIQQTVFWIMVIIVVLGVGSLVT